MERADGNRKMWLLKCTSGHHRPECLAAALALGILAGLVPKLNLLAAILYGLILVLPVHTFLALVVSAGVAMLSFQLDATAHNLGEYLLRQESLRPLWGSLERTPLVPWMSLHNTVVLGHFVMGLVLLAPMYLISVRIFERIEYGRRSAQPAQVATIQSYALVSTEEAEPLTTKKDPYRHRDGAPDQRTAELPTPQESTVDRSPLIIPPPKLHRVAADADSESRLNGPDEPILFEPVADDGQRMGAWHMNHATGEAQYATGSRSPNANAQSATAKAAAKGAGSAKLASPTLSSDSFFPQISEAYSVESSLQQSGQTLPITPIRPEGVLSSLELAQNTSEVLAWVDDLLDECMAAEGMPLVSQYYDQAVNSKEPRASSSDTDAMVGERSTQPRWLLETTIEIVRLTDDTMSDQLFVAEETMNGAVASDSPETRSMESSRVMPAESMTRAWPGVGGGAIATGSVEPAMPARESGEPTILNLSQASARNRTDPRTGFQQIVMAGVLKDSVGKDLEQRPTLPIEPVKGECLAYLLGHLRQSREGKST